MEHKGADVPCSRGLEAQSTKPEILQLLHKVISIGVSSYVPLFYRVTSNIIVLFVIFVRITQTVMN